MEFLKKNDFKSFGVVCHDAGGANQIAALIKTTGECPRYVVAEGPAAEIWSKAHPLANRRNDLDWINDVNLVITGTGWASDLEHNARVKARQANVRAVALLDHWVNYPDRFCRHSEVVLPEEFWVVDDYAELIARQCFAGASVKRIPDYFSENEIRMISSISSVVSNNLLYLCEPLRANWGRDELGEYQALKYFLERLPGMGFPDGLRVFLRIHPSEQEGKYDRFIGYQNGFFVAYARGGLAESISDSRWVVGCQTFAMTLALKAGRRVFCSLPPWAPRCSLPHRGIEPI